LLSNILIVFRLVPA